MAGENREIKSCVIRFSSLGDVLLTLPLIGPLAEATGGMVAFITREPYRTLLERHPEVGAVFTIPGRGSDKESGLNNVVDNVNASIETLEYVFDIHDVTLSRHVLRRISAKQKLKYKKDAVKRLLLAATGIDLLPEPALSVPDKYARALTPAEVNAPDYNFRIDVDREQAEHFATDNGLKPGFIAIAPRARYETKSWQKGDFAEVIKALSERGYKIALFDEEPLGEWGDALVKAGAKDVSGITPLDILPEAVSGAAAIICNDSALAHLGPLLGVPVVDIFGPTSPRFGFAAFGERDVTLYADYPCSPCTRHGKRKCWRGDKACMDAIPPEQVVDALLTVVEGA